jgi:diacylglycerol kinase (ATP)
MSGNKSGKFSFRQRMLSFKYAFNGIFLMLKNEHNAWIHSLAAVFAVSAGFYFGITKHEWIAVILAIAVDIAAEAFNSAIELLVDKISPDYDVSAGKIKDMAAGAVLITAFAAAITGMIVFRPYFLQLFQ